MWRRRSNFPVLQRGKGAYYTWSGTRNEHAISGKVTISKSEVDKEVEYDFDFTGMKPMTGVFELKPSADGKRNRYPMESADETRYDAVVETEGIPGRQTDRASAGGWSD